MVTSDELRPEPSEGDIYFNPRRGNCLRIRRIYKCKDFNGHERMRVDCLSFRPDGAKGGVPLSMWVASLKDYLPVSRISVETPTGTYQWSNVDKTSEWIAVPLVAQFKRGWRGISK